jgi:DNA-binding NarL/FixJ family response regulator
MIARIFIVENNPLMRETLIEFIELQPEFEVCGATEGAEEALRVVGGADPDLVLVDMSLPGMNGAELAGALRKSLPGLPCLMLSGHGESAYVEVALAAGARGYVLKGDPTELPVAIRHVIGGRQYLSKSLRHML